MDEGSLRKYLVYAAGEILLVMIGILLALQVNNWNQANSEERITQDYIKNIITELDSDLNYFKQLQSQNLGQMKLIDDLQIALNSTNKKNHNDEELILKLMDAMRMYPFQPKTATYVDLVTSGKMGLIKPLGLRQKIISHYNLLEQKSSHISKEIDYNWNHIHSFFNDNGYFEWRNHPLISLDTVVVKKTKHFSLLKLNRSSSEFRAVENNLLFRKMFLAVRNQNLEELIESTDKLIAGIQEKFGNQK